MISREKVGRWGEDVSLFCPVFYAATMTRILSQGRAQKLGYGVVAENIRGFRRGGASDKKFGKVAAGAHLKGQKAKVQVLSKCRPDKNPTIPTLPMFAEDRTDVAFCSYQSWKKSR